MAYEYFMSFPEDSVMLKACVGLVMASAAAVSRFLRSRDGELRPEAPCHSKQE